MKIDKLLISSAMLAAMCEKTGADNLKMLESFVLVCLADICEPKETIPKDKILIMLDERFALRSMPEAVLDKILSRIANGGSRIVRETRFTRVGHQFELVQRPMRQACTFREQEEKARRDTEDVINALISWMQNNTTAAKPTIDETKKYLGSFFESNGFDILFEPEELRGATIRNTDEINYQIGRFILSAQEHDSNLFEKIVAIAQGMVLASVIYVDTTPASKLTARRRLTEVDVFLDTTFLLYALGYKTPDQKHTADVLLDLLQTNGANLYVFQDHFAEIVEILNSFKDKDAYDQKNGQILESLIEDGYTSIEIDSEIRNLKSSLMQLGINIAPETRYTNTNGELIQNRDAYIDYVGLKDYLIKQIPQYGKHPKMLENDVSAIGAIMVKRAGVTYTDIESCNAIFVTTNYTLVRKGNQFLHYSPYSMHIAPIISDTDLTTILWIKYAMTMCGEISKLQLVEHARAALTPSASVMEAFNSIAQRMVKKGTITQDEAANIRYSAYARAEIVAMCGGNASMLDDTSILAVRDRVKKQYATMESERADQAYASAQQARRVAKAAKANAATSARELEAVKRKGKIEIAALRKEAENKAGEYAHLFGRAAEIAVALVVLAIMIVAGGATIKAGVSTTLSIPGAIALIAAVISAVVLWLPCFKLSKQLYRIISIKLSAKFYAIELNKRQKEIDRIALVSGLAEGSKQ
ncbi:MAG: hypothetical protein HDT38_02690 [Clostridiales bacterium]|nr:hypothetical protein [Clostridiales bacterium]